MKVPAHTKWNAFGVIVGMLDSPTSFLFHFSACPMVDVSLYRLSLFRERLMEHQKGRTPHLESVLQVSVIEPVLQHHGIGDSWDFSNLL